MLRVFKFRSVGVPSRGCLACLYIMARSFMVVCLGLFCVPALLKTHGELLDWAGGEVHPRSRAFVGLVPFLYRQWFG